MQQTIQPLTLAQLEQQIAIFKSKYPTVDPNTVAVVLGDDEELNGVHDAYFASEVDAYLTRDKYLTGMIKDSRFGSTPMGINPRVSFMLS